MVQFYKSDALNEILAKLLFKCYENNLSCVVVFENNEVAEEVSKYIWILQKHFVPHALQGDEYFEKNDFVFIYNADFIPEKDAIIIFDNCKVSSNDLKKYKKSFVLGAHYDDLEGVYWILNENKWVESEKIKFFSKA